MILEKEEWSMEHIDKFKAAVTGALAALTALWGWYGWLLVAWAASMALDYITGSCAALKAGEWSSKVAREGLWHKAGSVAAVLVALLLDLVVGQVVAQIPNVELPFSYSVLLGPLVVVWYILTEAGSIIENAGRLGAPIAPWMKKAIAALRETVDQEVD